MISISSKNRFTLMDLQHRNLSSWYLFLKRLIDVAVALLGLFFLFPLLIIVAIITSLSSKGSVIYSQERIGYKGKKFFIYKFRSMYADAEKDGPALSSNHDVRTTAWGRFMRTWRLDELPQLWNILIGDMSLVGPRPERKFYIDKITEQTKDYTDLLKVKPGLTSWGMIQFGYASSVDEMIKRMQYDLHYVERASLFLDLKIMLHTLKLILMGQGK